MHYAEKVLSVRDGLPKFIANNRNIENDDIVLWHTFGHTHVCKPEDMPVMACEYAGFTLKPNGFFVENPANDVPPSAKKSAGKSCCGG